MTALPMTPALRRIRFGALWVLGIIVFAADLVAFAESYNGLRAWAHQHRVTAGWADAWPLQVDAFILAGEICLLLAVIYGWSRRARLLGWTMSLSGLGASIAWNAGHVGAGATTADHITAAVPPIAAMAGLAAALSVIKHLAVAVIPDHATSGRLDVKTSDNPGPLPVTLPGRAGLLAGMTYELAAATLDATVALTNVDRMISATDVPVDVPTHPVDPDPEPEPPKGLVDEARWVGFLTLPPSSVSQTLQELPSDAARVRAALYALGIDAQPAQVRDWLDDRGVVLTPEYLRTAVRRERRRNEPPAPLVSIVREG